MSTSGFALAPGVSGYDLCVAQFGDGSCSTLQALGATDTQLGAITVGDDPAGNYSALLMQLTGQTTPAGTAAVPSENLPTSSIADEILGAPGSVLNGASVVGSDIGSALGSVGSWFSSNWLWIALAVLAVILLVVFVYGAARNL